MQTNATTKSVYEKKFEPHSILKSKKKWVDKDYRESYMESFVYQMVAWQMKTIRKRNSTSLEDVSIATGIAASTLNEFEDPDFEGRDIESLIKIANYFGFALSVEFVSYSQLAYKSHNLSPDDLFVYSFDQESSFKPENELKNYVKHQKSLR